MYCGGDLVQDKRIGPIHCCGCHSVMTEVNVQGTVIDVCPSCSGIWFDTGELEEVLEKLELPHDGLPESNRGASLVKNIPESAPPRNCPHCNLIMGKKNYKRFSGVIVDICRFHGLYLDAGELEKIQLFMATGGAQKEQSMAEFEEREAQKALKRAKKRSRLNEVRSSSLRTRYSKQNAETETYYDVFGIISSFLTGFWS